MKGNAYLSYILALLLFGSNGVVASRIALASFEIVLLRTMIGSMFLLILFHLKGRRFRGLGRGRDFLFLIASGVAMGVSWMFLYEAYRWIGVSFASLLYYCGPVIVMALSPLLFREKLTLPRLVGFVVVLAGILLVNGRTEGRLNHWGVVCGLLSAVMYALMVILNKKSAITGLANSSLQLFASFLTAAVFAVAKGGVVLWGAAADWPWILLLGLVNTGIGCYLYFSSIGKLPVQTVAVCGYLEPLAAVVFSVLLLGERMTFAQGLGTALVFGGSLFGSLLPGRGTQ